MITRTTAIGTLAVAFVCSFTSAPAHARARVFVASYGNDANPCTFLSPCRTFQQAVSVVDAGGEVTAIDSAGFGPISIGFDVTITSPPGIEAGIAASSGQPAIVVNTVNGAVVSLHRLTLDGAGVATDGIIFLGGGRVEVFDSVIRNFAHDGINIALGSGFNLPTKTFIIANTVVSGNGSSGVEISPLSGFAARGALDRVSAVNNGQSGILIDATNATNNGFVDVSISEVISESNGGAGITVKGVGNAKVEIRSSTISNNVNTGLVVSNARVGITKNSIILNGAGFSNTNGTIFTFVDNIIENNRDPNTGTLTTAGPQ